MTVATRAGDVRRVQDGGVRSVRPQANRIPSDYVVLCELAMRQPFVHAPEAMIWRRIHAGNRFRDPRARMVWFEPGLQLTGQIRLPFWRYLGDMAVMMLRVDDGSADRLVPLLVGGGPRRLSVLAQPGEGPGGRRQDGADGQVARLERYRRAAGSAIADPQPGDFAPSSLRVALVDKSDRAAVCAEVDRLIGAGHMATVLVSRLAAHQFVDVVDALRVAGVPVQVCRSPTGFERRTGSLGEFAVTVAAVVDSGADSVHVLPGSGTCHSASPNTIARDQRRGDHRLPDGERGTSGNRHRAGAPGRCGWASFRAAKRRKASRVERASFDAEPRTAQPATPLRAGAARTTPTGRPIRIGASGQRLRRRQPLDGDRRRTPCDAR